MCEIVHKCLGNRCCCNYQLWRELESISESKAEEDVEPVQHESLKVGDWVVVYYEGNGKCFPGKVTEIGENEGDVRRVNVMRPSGLSGSVWFLHKDDIFYKKEHVIKHINPPFPVDNRSGYKFNESILKDH